MLGKTTNLLVFALRILGNVKANITEYQEIGILKILGMLCILEKLEKNSNADCLSSLTSLVFINAILFSTEEIRFDACSLQVYGGWQNENQRLVIFGTNQ